MRNSSSLPSVGSSTVEQLLLTLISKVTSLEESAYRSNSSNTINGDNNDAEVNENSDVINDDDDVKTWNKATLSCRAKKSN